MNRDNGSSWGSFCTAVALVLAVVLGYHLRLWGWTINIDGPAPAKSSTGGKP
jgi:hypothetical protein